jgi:hypothetical protein
MDFIKTFAHDPRTHPKIRVRVKRFLQLLIEKHKSGTLTQFDSMVYGIVDDYMHARLLGNAVTIRIMTCDASIDISRLKTLWSSAGFSVDDKNETEFVDFDFGENARSIRTLRVIFDTAVRAIESN